MKHAGKRWALAALALAPWLAQAQVDLRTLDKDMTGRRTQVMVLGTIHLVDIVDVEQVLR